MGYDTLVMLWGKASDTTNRARFRNADYDAAYERFLRTPDLKGKLTAQGLDAVGNTPDQFSAYIRQEIEKWTRVVKVTGARAD